MKRVGHCEGWLQVSDYWLGLLACGQAVEYGRLVRPDRQDIGTYMASRVVFLSKTPWSYGSPVGSCSF